MSITPRNRHHKHKPSKKNGISYSAISLRITLTERCGDGSFESVAKLPCKLIDLWSDVDYGGSPGKTSVNICSHKESFAAFVPSFRSSLECEQPAESRFQSELYK